MNVLALDLGTETGYAYNVGEKFHAGTWSLATAKQIKSFRKQRMDRRCDPRILQLQNWLVGTRNLTFSSSRLHAVVFEDVQFSTYTLQTQLWSSLRAVVWLTFSDLLIECVPVTTLKKFATGHGGATKSIMRRCLEASPELEHIDLTGFDDNAVDAVWIWQWAQHNLKRAKI